MYTASTTIIWKVLIVKIFLGQANHENQWHKYLSTKNFVHFLQENFPNYNIGSYYTKCMGMIDKLVTQNLQS